MIKIPEPTRITYQPEIISASSYEDERGSIYSITGGSHNKQHRLESKLNLIFFHTKITKNKAGVFRGFHTDHKSWKKCTCIEGEIKAIIIDPGNKTYVSYSMNSQNKEILLTPPNWQWFSITDRQYLRILFIVRWRLRRRKRSTDYQAQRQLLWNQEIER